MPVSSEPRCRLWAAALALAGTCLLPMSALASPPNVLIVLADDLGWNDVGYHGSEIRTPHLDMLAAAGAPLSQFHSQPTCTPTRVALMTGKSPQRLGIYRQFAKNSTHGLPTSETTLADHLQRAGYQTWQVGKWHLGHAERKYLPNARGFDHFYGHVTGGIGYWDHVHGGGLDWQRNGTTVREQGYSTHLLAEEAIRLIEQRDRTRPFFLYASFNAPHLPNEAPETALGEYAAIVDPYRRTHAAMVSELDSAIGQLLAVLDAEQLTENTLIWFMSDNGGLNPVSAAAVVPLVQQLQDWFGKPLPVTFLEFLRTNALEGGSDNGPLRLGKGSVYEGGVRVPSLVHWPGVIEAGQLDAPVTVQDVLPTVLSAAGLDTPSDLDGRSQWPLLTGGTPAPPADYITIGQTGEQAYYQWPWKLVALEDVVELYNLDTDPYEAHNVAAQHPERVTALQVQLSEAPRAPTLHIPIWRVMWDPDFFGGTEDRAPWADVID